MAAGVQFKWLFRAPAGLQGARAIFRKQCVPPEAQIQVVLFEIRFVKEVALLVSPCLSLIHI